MLCRGAENADLQSSRLNSTGDIQRSAAHSVIICQLEDYKDFCITAGFFWNMGLTKALNYLNDWSAIKESRHATIAEDQHEWQPRITQNASIHILQE